ncbi:MAG: DUF5611 family protein [Candidatus Thermoplasmatota archaeon]|jgi:hypothetical protein|nr:DUF5611 family protein [Candidatus Thermoplasmatota archaeon]
MAREYPVKKGIKLSLETIREKAESIAGEARIDGSHVFSRCPGLSEIDLTTDGKKLLVQTKSDGIKENAAEALRIYNRLIEEITGYSSKERKKLISKV